MTAINQTATWQALQQHYEQTRHVQMREQFQADKERFANMHERFHGILFDFSKNRINEETLDLLCELAHIARVAEKAYAMKHGEIINNSEKRAVLHTALRVPENHEPIFVHDENIIPAVQRELNRALMFAENVLNGSYSNAEGNSFTDLVHIGIGGSDLGPQTAAIALAPYHKHIRVHFVSNADDAAIAQILSKLDAKRTLFSIASKTFSTPETLMNAESARTWFLNQGMSVQAIKRHFVAISSNLEAVEKFGIAAENTFAMFDWVGGRYSMWSAIGLPLMIAIGPDHFRELLTGAYTMDEHFFQTPYRHNIPVLMALLGVWYTNFYGAESHAVIPYSHLLRRLPAHLQQLDMESNGKHVTRDGETIDYATGPIIWGEEGVNCQHAFFQLIHQGTRLIPVDFIVPMITPYDKEKQAFVVANAFAQAEALMRGKTYDEALELLSNHAEDEAQALAKHNEFTGNRPSNTLLLDRLDPFSIGALIAMYEHKVFVQGAIWDINSFDQWGVEYGKVLAKNILPELTNYSEPQHDSSTNGLIEYYRSKRHLR